MHGNVSGGNNFSASCADKMSIFGILGACSIGPRNPLIVQSCYSYMTMNWWESNLCPLNNAYSTTPHHSKVT